MGKVNEMVIAIQEMLDEGYSYEKIATKLNISIKWVIEVDKHMQFG